MTKKATERTGTARSTSTPSRERTLGRAVLGDERLGEVIEAFAEDDHRTVPNAVQYLLLKVLTEWGWLAYDPEDGYVPGAHLEAHRRRKADGSPEIPADMDERFRRFLLGVVGGGEEETCS